MSENVSQIEGWGILELMGHRRLGGFLSEVSVAGSAMVRIDVPHPQNLAETAATQFYSGQSIYCIMPTTEEIARAIARGAPEPVSRWDLRELEPRTGEASVGIVDVPFEDESDLEDDPDFEDQPIMEQMAPVIEKHPVRS